MIKVNVLPGKLLGWTGGVWESCSNCQMLHLIITEGLCVYCRETREWSQRNRAFCNLIHKGHNGR